MIECTTIQTGGNRVIRTGTYQADSNDGEPPEVRVFLAAGWDSTASLPLGRQVVDLPVSALPALIAALQAVEVD